MVEVCQGNLGNYRLNLAGYLLQNVLPSICVRINAILHELLINACVFLRLDFLPAAGLNDISSSHWYENELSEYLGDTRLDGRCRGINTEATTSRGILEPSFYGGLSMVPQLARIKAATKVIPTKVSFCSDVRHN